MESVFNREYIIRELELYVKGNISHKDNAEQDSEGIELTR